MVLLGTSKDSCQVESSSGVSGVVALYIRLYTLCGLVVRSRGTTLGFPAPQCSAVAGVLVSVVFIGLTAFTLLIFIIGIVPNENFLLGTTFLGARVYTDVSLGTGY